jgi:hypothetical protein
VRAVTRGSENRWSTDGGLSTSYCERLLEGNIYIYYIMYIYILCLYIYYVYGYIWKSLQIHCRKSFGKDLQLVDFDKTWKSLSMYWKLRI